MQTIDIIILVCLVPFIIQGFSKGFISQLTALVSVILGIWMSSHFSKMLSDYLRPYIEVSDAVLNVISFILILLAVILVLYLVGKAVEKLVKLVMLGWLDKLLGMALSLLKGILLLGLFVVLFNTLNVKFEFVPEQTLESSVLYPPLKEITYTIFPFLKEMLFSSAA